jgi:hypothetical protein
LKSPQVSGLCCRELILCISLFAFSKPTKLIGAMPKARARKFPEEKKWSVAQLEPLRDCLIARQISMMEIIQQTAALADHDQKAAPRAMVFDIFLQMFGQVIDALGQKSDLHVGGPCVALVQSEPCYRLSFFHIQFDQYS